MSAPDAGRPPRAGMRDQQDSAVVRRLGRQLVANVSGALRAIRLYPAENEAVRIALDELCANAALLLEREGELEVRTTAEFIFVNSTRLRLELDNYASFSQVLSILRAFGVGALLVGHGAGRREWLVLLSLLLQPRTGEGITAADLNARLAEAGVTCFDCAPPLVAEDDGDARERAREAAKRTYAQSVSVTREVMGSFRLGGAPNLRKIKRVVQSIVDQILSEETSLIGLTTIRDYDEYTFTHSVNVCIFSVALGRRLGLSKLQLYDLGLAALFHDIGKSRLPVQLLNKTDGLTDEDWHALAAHPWLGVLALFHMRGQQEVPYRAMVVAYEHHMRMDLTGYPRPVRPRAQGMFSRIVAVADGFDAATSRRSYQTMPMSPAAVIAGMRDNAGRGLDPVVVKGFMSLLGIYPVGTLVVLDTFELAIVHAINADPAAVARPTVRIISDDRGNVVTPGRLVDLTERDGTGTYLRTIIKTENPERYGVDVGAYFR